MAFNASMAGNRPGFSIVFQVGNRYGNENASSGSTAEENTGGGPASPFLVNLLFPTEESVNGGSNDSFFPIFNSMLPQMRMIIDALRFQAMNNDNPTRRVRTRPDFIASLESTPWNGESFGEDCTVCLESFQEGEEVVPLPCNHVYHRDCLIPWLEINHVCPTCREELPTGNGGSAAGTATTTVSSDNVSNASVHRRGEPGLEPEPTTTLTTTEHPVDMNTQEEQNNNATMDMDAALNAAADELALEMEQEAEAQLNENKESERRQQLEADTSQNQASVLDPEQPPPLV